MSIRLLVQCLLLFLISVLSIGTALAADEGNEGEDNEKSSSELWQELYIKSPIYKKLTGSILINTLYKTETGLYDYFIEPNIKYTINSRVALEAFYRHEWYIDDGEWVVEKRVQQRISLSWRAGNWSIRNRHRLEERFVDNSDMKFRYRLDLKVSAPSIIKKGSLRPYILEELFFDSGGMGRVRNYLGVDYTPSESSNFSYQLYGLIQMNRIEKSNFDIIKAAGLAIEYRLPL